MTTTAEEKNREMKKLNSFDKKFARGLAIGLLSLGLAVASVHLTDASLLGWLLACGSIAIGAYIETKVLKL